MKNKITVSVGIPAYNEEKNIGKLLSQIAVQKIKTGKELVEIIIISDGSSDKTIDVCNKVRIPKLRIFSGRKRTGKNERLNQLMKMATGEVIVLFDADIALADEFVIDSIVNAFRTKNVGLVAGNAQPIKGKTISEKAFNNFVNSLNFMKDRIDNGNNVYSVRGPILALSREFADKIYLPRAVPDDKFLYFKCLDEGYKFFYQNKASVFFKSPQTIEEQIAQSIRFKNDKENLFSIFKKELIENEYFIPFRLKLQGVILQIIKSPIGYFIMKYIQFKMVKSHRKTSHTWEIIATSKAFAAV